MQSNVIYCRAGRRKGHQLSIGWESPLLPPFSLGYVNCLVFLLVAPFSIAMARIGVRIASRTAHDKLIKVFAGLLIIVGLRMIYRAWFV